MKIRLVMPTENCHGNILWPMSAPARDGKFPPSHPVAPYSPVFGALGDQFGYSDSLHAFRARGHWASCFPEGDGIVFQTGATVDQLKRDIEECFGFEVAL